MWLRVLLILGCAVVAVVARSAFQQPLSRRSRVVRPRAPTQPHGAAGPLTLRPTVTPAALGPVDVDIIHIAGDVVAGFVGGTVGVLGTILALEYKMKKVDERSKCPYCCGAGTIQCAHCYGGAVVCFKHMDAQGTVEERDCPSCQGTGAITCINCKGDGLAIPVMLNKKLSRDPETRLEALGLG